MYDMGRWQPLGHQTVHSFPRQRFLLSTAFQYAIPQFRGYCRLELVPVPSSQALRNRVRVLR